MLVRPVGEKFMRLPHRYYGIGTAMGQQHLAGDLAEGAARRDVVESSGCKRCQFFTQKLKLKQSGESRRAASAIK